MFHLGSIFIWTYDNNIVGRKSTENTSKGLYTYYVTPRGGVNSSVINAFFTYMSQSEFWPNPLHRGEGGGGKKLPILVLHDMWTAPKILAQLRKSGRMRIVH